MPPRKPTKKQLKEQEEKEKQEQIEQEQQEAVEEEAAAQEAQDDDEGEDDGEAAVEEEPTATAGEGGADAPKLSMEERKAKMLALRKRLTESATANRKDLITETNTQRTNARTLAKLERKRLQAEAMGEKQEARETGEDLERKKAWEYTIEDNERWDKKVARKGRRADFSFTDYDDIARRKYKKDMDTFKPDHVTYNAQRALASSSNTSSALIASSSSSQIAAAEDLYRDANSFVYADHKPSEEAIDRVIGKINLDLDKRQKRSRAREEDEGDITYINEKNKHFNKKLERYYNQHTKDIKDSFERGTAI